ncbi:MAG: phospho-sugar mutase, partial [Clostridia bacterium]|nr:phospho-sugar mutase [Clostridia bacterium]
VMAVTALAEAAAYYKNKGLTLWDQMLNIYKKYGYYKEGLATQTLPGAEGAEKIAAMIEEVRKNPPKVIGGYRVLAFRDYEKDVRISFENGEEGKTGLPKSNVLYFELENNGWCCVRPSGTEPKIKFYFGVKGNSIEQAEKALQGVKADLLRLAE